jgi:hypothetical protein
MMRGGGRWEKKQPIDLIPEAKRIPRLKILTIVILYLFSLGRIIADFFQQSSDWDIDHEIYFGQELLRGNLLWTVEFHDKLPVVQYFFALAAAFYDPLIAWRLISIFSALLAIICVIRLLPEVLRKIGYLNEKMASYAAIFSGGIYMCVSSVVPGRFTHINVISASMAIMAVLLGFTLLRHENKLWEIFSTASLAGAAGAIGISFRPYFLFPLVISFLIIGFLIVKEKSLALKQKSLRVSGLLLMPCIMGIGLNLGPYVLLGKREEFFSGLSFILQPAQAAGSIIDFFLEPGFGFGWFLRFWLGGMLLYSLIEVGISSRRGSAGLMATFIPLSALLLVIAILSQHFWSHYINLFSWYFAILLAVKLVSLDQLVPPLRRRYLQLFLPSTAVSLVFAVLVLSVSSFEVDKPAREHPNKALVLALETYFSRDPLPRPIFLAPENMYVHWKLEEPRHGFPHASSTLHIFQGLWEDVNGSHTFRDPINMKAYCYEILQSPIETIILIEGSDLQPCFSKRKKQFHLEQILMSDSGNWNLWSKK